MKRRVFFGALVAASLTATACVASANKAGPITRQVTLRVERGNGFARVYGEPAALMMFVHGFQSELYPHWKMSSPEVRQHIERVTKHLQTRHEIVCMLDRVTGPAFEKTIKPFLAR
jgi:hypothetical protein